MRIEVPDPITPVADLEAVHLVGVGGAGLSAIARLMSQQGVRVSGSDAQDSAVLRALRAEGIDARVGHDPALLADVDVVVASTAVREDNPEVVEAVRRGLPLWPRSAGLASLMASRRTVAVAGTHGKTTTTAMLTCALRAAGADPTFAIGAEVETLGTNAATGGELFVAEADESDGAFLVYHPPVAVVTNVDADHLDVWGTEEAYAAAFAEFVGTVGELVVLGVDDPGAAALVTVAEARGLDVVTVALDASLAPDVHVDDVLVRPGRTTFRARWRDGSHADVELAVTGAHYALDAALALATGVRLGLEPRALADGLGTYRGARRRMERVGEAAGVEVLDSYAHHPTEIRADLAAARAVADGRRLVVVFQPHLVSRTRRHGVDMGRALSVADEVVVADLYLAREDPDPEVTSHLVVDAVDGPPARAGGPVATLAAALEPTVRDGDLVLTLGAGDVTTVGPALLRLLAERT